MPTFRHGKNSVILLDKLDASQYFKESTTSRSIDTADVTAFGATAKSYVTTMRDGTLSLKGMVDYSTGAVDDLFNGFIGATTDPVITVAIEGSTTGTLVHMAGAIDTAYEVSSPIADVNQLSATFQADGGLDSGRLLMAGATIATATTTNSTGVDNAAASSNGGVAHLHATANTRSAVTNVKVQHSTDNSTWVDLVTFTAVAISTTSAERIVVATGTTVNRYLRAQVVTTGTGSITTSVAFARR